MDYDVRFVVVRLADVGLVAVGLLDVGIMLVNVRHYVIFVIYMRCL